MEYDETEQKRLIRNLIDGWRSIFDGEAPLAGGWLAMAAALFAQSLGLLAVCTSAPDSPSRFLRSISTSTFVPATGYPCRSFDSYPSELPNKVHACRSSQ